MLFTGTCNPPAINIDVKESTKSAEKEKIEVIADTKDEVEKLTPDTVIYKYGGANPWNLTPRSKDLESGLSFSLIPLPNSAKTTIGAVNSTGILFAYQDNPLGNPNHITIIPTNASVEEWYKAGKHLCGQRH